MKFNKFYIILILLAMISGCNNGHIKKNSAEPTAPQGFTWFEAKNNVGSFLKPNGWHVLEESNGKTNALFISRENIKVNGKFIVGFSVNQINSYSTNSSLKPSQYAKVFIQKIIDKSEVIKAGVVKGGPSEMNIARVKGNNAGVKTIVHHIAIGLDNPDILYLVSFETPESEWEEYYPIAGKMLNYLLLGT